MTRTKEGPSVLGQMGELIATHDVRHVIWALGTSIKTRSHCLVVDDKYSNYLTDERLRLIGEMLQDISDRVWKTN
jgi:hypothetical protein